MNPLILVVGCETDRQTRHQIEAFARQGARVLVWDPTIPPRGLVWGDDGGFLQGVALVDVGAVFVRTLPPSFVPTSAFAKGPLDQGGYHEELCVTAAWSDTILGALLALEMRGVPMCNAPSRMLLSRKKPFQLDALRRAGVPLPRTLITSEAGAAQAFAAQVGEAIVKPAAGGALTRPFEELTPAELAFLNDMPCIVQERIRGDDLRVTVLDGEVISTAAVVLAEELVDFRGDSAYASGRGRYLEVDLPSDVKEACCRAAAAVGLRFAGIDVKRTAAGRHVLLEVNSSSIYLDVELKLGHPITALLATRLMADAAAARVEGMR